MKRKIFYLFFILLLGTLTFSQDLNKIIDCSIKASGGKENLAKINSIHLTGKVISMGMTLPINIYMKKPDKLRFETIFQGNKIVQIVNGKKGWMINPLLSPEPKEMDKSTLKMTKDQFSNLSFISNFKKLGYTAKYIGKVDVEGGDAYKLEFTKKGREPLYFYIDTDSCIPIKSDFSVKKGNNKISGSIFFSNYKKVNGVYFPFSIRVKSGRMEQNIVFTSIKINENLSDTLFEVKGMKKTKEGDVKNEKK